MPEDLFPPGVSSQEQSSKALDWLSPCRWTKRKVLFVPGGWS